MSAIKPFIYFSLVAFGLFLGIWLKPSSGVFNNSSPIDEAISLAKAAYVDTINEQQLKQTAIESMLANLDPHSVYIPAKDLAESNEPLEGGFDGIGVEFNIYKDTILVVSSINGGPSQSAGIISGDKIVKVNNKIVAGIKITNEQVMKLLKGPKGTKVSLGIQRRNKARLLSFEIIRDKIPIYSVDAGYMIDAENGYIKISRFAETTYDEFLARLKKLKEKGLKNLILDLRGNPGGYLTAATKITDELLSDKKLIVYTEGLHQKKSEYFCEKEGLFETGNLIIIIDEGSASASEIVSGSIQDSDRGLILGRRSFGKGLVQEQMQLSDGSGLRLTVARYYTPSGRCIQKAYDHDIEGYESEVYDRYKNGELAKLDSAKITKHKAFKTLAGRTVYDGGGITPDIFVPADTGGHYSLINAMLQENVLRNIAIDLNEKYKSEFNSLKQVNDIDAAWKKIEKEAEVLVNIEIKRLGFTHKASPPAVKQVLLYVESVIARLHFSEEGFYYIYNQKDKNIIQALSVFKSKKEWKFIE